MRFQRTRIKTKRFILGAIPENLKQNERIESGRDAGEPKKKRRGSNLSAMAENLNQKEGIESRRDAGEPERIKEGIESGRDAREPESKHRD